MKKKFKILTVFTILSVILLDIFVNKVYATTYTNYEKTNSVSCGDVTGIPAFLPRMISFVYMAIQILVPVVLVILGSIDLLKGVTGQKEDEIKKGQQTFFKRLIAAFLVFFILTIVKLTTSLVSKKTSSIFDCVTCFIKNDCDVKHNDDSDDVEPTGDEKTSGATSTSSSSAPTGDTTSTSSNSAPTGGGPSTSGSLNNDKLSKPHVKN